MKIFFRQNPVASTNQQKGKEKIKQNLTTCTLII